MLLEFGRNWLQGAPEKIGKEHVPVILAGHEDGRIEEQQVRLYGKHDNLFQSLLCGGNGQLVIGDDLPGPTKVMTEEVGGSVGWNAQKPGSR
jgi:hypothetical protein